MQKQADRIDPVHSRAISVEIAERLRILLSKDRSPLPTHLRQRLDQLREMDEPTPSVVPAMMNETF
jgi:hypothetical protein